MNIYSILSVLTFSVLIGLSHFSEAESDQDVDNAIKDTQSLMKDQNQREALIKNDPKAKVAEDRVNAVTGGNTISNQKIHEIAADILPSLLQSVGNDPVKAMELLRKAETDPEGFYKNLPPEIKAQIRSVSSEIESASATKKSP